jgi:hypothetical protein
VPGYIRPATDRWFYFAVTTAFVSIAVSRRDKPQFFRSQRPVNSALGVRYSLSLRRCSATFRMVRVERDRPFPDMPPDALNDRIFDAAMFHCALDYPNRAFSHRATGYASRSAPACVNVTYPPEGCMVIQPCAMAAFTAMAYSS